MNILHIVEDYSLESGGLRTVIKDLNYYLNQNDCFSYIISSKKEKEDDIFLVETNNPWLFSLSWEKKIISLISKLNIDVIHIHGVWMFPQYLVAKYCVKKNIPFILSSHGMYEPWLWKKGTIKKKLYFLFLTKNLFSKATFIHAITPQEKLNLKKLFKVQNVFEIPNLIDGSINVTSNKKDEKDEKEKYILYLGRLDEKKGINILLQAFSNLNSDNYKLKIAGKINEYYPFLKKLAEELNIEERIEFLGLVKGDEKIKLIKNAISLVAPSFSEVVGMVNLEAAILKTVVITSRQTGINPKWNENGGLLINPNVIEVTTALEKVLSWSDNERIINGEKLYKFVKLNYSWSNRFQDWMKIYMTCKTVL